MPVPTPAPGPPAGPLSSKLSPPLSQARQVLRQAVVRRMADAGGVKLLLVRAPAGFGKTTAMVQAREQLAASGVATAWLTLERTDNDAPRFLACLQQAVAQIVGQPGAPAALPGRTMRLVVTRVSHATRASGSWARKASTTVSEIRSATLSGWPSETLSLVKI